MLHFYVTFFLIKHMAHASDLAAVGSPATAGDLPLTNAVQILERSYGSPTESVPAQIRGIVTYSDPSWEVCYVQDKTAGLFILRGTNNTQLLPGMEVEVSGVARPGGFAPMLDEMGSRILGTNALPLAERVGFDQIQGGRMDSQWIEMEGIVHAITVEDGHLRIRFWAPKEMQVYLYGFTNAPSQEILRLVDARVRMRGVCSTQYSAQGNLLNPTLLMPDLRSIEILEPPSTTANLPVQPLAAPLRYTNARRYGHRIKVAATVIAQDNPRVYFMQDESGAAYVQTRDAIQFTPGDRVEMTAFPEPGGATPNMVDAVVNLVSHGPLPTPIHIDASQVPENSWDCRLSTVEGECVEAIFEGNAPKFIMRSGDRLFDAFCDFPKSARFPVGDWRGARLSFTGVVAVELDDGNNPVKFHITSKNPNDIHIVHPAPWWSAARALKFFGTVTVIFASWGLYGMFREARLKEEYRLIFDNATDLVSTHNLDGGFTTANRSWELNSGLPLKVLKTMRFDGVLDNRHRQAWRDWWKVVCSGANAPAMELEIVGSGEKRIWLEISGLFIKDRRGKPQVECIGRDVTRRRRSEHLRTGQRKTLELIASSAPLPDTLNQLIIFIESQAPGMIGSILLLDADGVTLRHGAAPSLPIEYNQQIDGLKSGEGVGSCGTAVARRSQVIVSDIASDPLWTPFCPLAAMFGLRACWSTPIFSRSGQVLGTFAIYFREPRSPIAEDVELIEVACSLASIAIERKQAEAALQQISMLQRAILDSAGFSIISTGLDGRILSFNRAAERMLEWTSREVVGNLNVTEFHDPEEITARAHALSSDLGRPIAANFQVFSTTAGGNDPDEREWTYIKKNGDRIPVLVSTTTLADTAGNFAGYLYVGADLTSRKRDEQLRIQMETQLRQSQKMQAIGTLAGGIAHDFNNILSAILGNAELLKLDLPKGPAYQDSLAGILKASERARILVRHILAFSRSEEPERQPLSLKPVIMEALELIRASLPATVEIQLELESTHFQVLANSTQIHQVLMNLCSNASHAMDRKPGKIEISKKLVHLSGIDATAKLGLQRGRYIVITVTDNGHGMDAQTQERIFEPFYTTKRPGDGTGLGLSVVHGIMQSHEGAITVTSSPGQGSSFHLYFPAIKVFPPPAPEASSAPCLGQGQRILIVDDEPAIATLAVRILTRLNYSPISMTNAAAAALAFETTPEAFDLVITDLTMPHLTGLDLARRILAVRPELPIILCTGHRSAEQESEFARLGIRKVLNKPFHAEVLAQAIHDVLSVPA